ncbi:AtpZ/AtpI family protein [candidate division KSB1 bacterium]|nr:AtpZ/AtpI family protein [candidate division KSB1 bacterium]NIR72744.1 AtpZ/AtpI family protein [candidate division KSB1 bacterium]NIS26832.1 AtpZ/AtpI family protein [candidate division KSB1 bacterium]NIT73626.1 AtpZ/AtpI family protein [candidate division KSB1 bacterium]NIU27499.1 AtpZ/AtpI family protein [candidate division KSB1 bacterium]
MGLRFAIAIAIGVGGGYWLDSKIHTTPLFLVLGLLLGATSGFLTIYRTVYSPKSTKEEKRE